MIGISTSRGRSVASVVLALAVGLTGACAMDSQPADEAAAAESVGLLEVVATGLSFQAPDSVPAGWTRIRFRNESGVVHFALLEKMPEGITIEDSRNDVVPVFQEATNLLLAGRAEESAARFGDLPAWYSSVVMLGGPGLTAAAHTSEVVVKLEPGTYVLECYVKTPEGEFHSYLGMLHQVVVTADSSEATEPTATMTLRVANDGFTLEGEAAAGANVVAVHFDEQMVHGNFLGSDVHLARIGDGVDVDSLNAWMTWATPSGLATPAPAEFVTGIHEMPAGQMGYIDVELEPGEYAWIAEVDDPASKGMLRTFTVN